jgi:hypothetical protein
MNKSIAESAVLSDLLEKNVQKLALEKIQRHLFLCCDQTKPKCCDKAVRNEK